MCDECHTGICGMFDELIRDYRRDFPLAISRQEDVVVEVRRPKFMPMDVSNAKESAATINGFSQMADAAEGIGLTRMTFLVELSHRSGFGPTIMAWAEGKVPNGLARKVILTAAEKILRERGARPELSLLDAA